jgi:hypothetical protein
VRATNTSFFSNTEADDYFRNDDFFLDIYEIFGDMSLTNNNGSSSTPALHAIFYHLFQTMMRIFLLSTCLDLLLSYSTRLHD